MLFVTIFFLIIINLIFLSESLLSVAVRFHQWVKPFGWTCGEVGGGYGCGGVFGEVVSGFDSEPWRVQMIMSTHRGACRPHSIKTSSLRCRMQREHGGELSPLQAAAHRMGSDMNSLRKVNSKVFSEAVFPGNSFVAVLRETENLSGDLRARGAHS